MTFLLEIGVEEIPAGFLPGGRAGLAEAARRVLIELAGAEFVAPATLRVIGSPRRLALFIDGLPARSSDRETLHKGPPLRAAYAADGSPTKAAEGFARKVGLSLERLEREGEYVVARVTTPGRAAAEILGEAMPRLLSKLAWPKSQRWNATHVRFVRPVRWLVALLDDAVLPFEWGGVAAGRVTRLRRSDGKGGVRADLEIASAASYLQALREQGILVDEAERAAFIRERIAVLAAEAGAEPVLVEGAATTAYLADLVEDPEPILGEFDAALAEAPREVLELTMWRHQKYVPLARDGALLPRFIVIGNRTFGPGDEAATARRRLNVLGGNRRVLSARLADARYFWSVDRERPLFDRLADLERVTFQKDAGSVRERVKRIEEIALRIAPLFGVTANDEVARAVRLSKADLTTKMVFEFPELQGVIGRRIAEAEGEAPEVAAAIEEHYWPLGADQRLPRGLSAVVALAEKADTLETIFGVGLEPTGSADPFGLRRAAIGIIRILLNDDRAVDLGTFLHSEKVLDFVRGRAINYLADQLGVSTSIIEATAAAGWHDLRDLARRAAAAARLPERHDFADLTTSFKRVMNILDGTGDEAVRTELLAVPAERALDEETNRLSADVAALLAAGRVEEALTAMAGIRPAVDRFFDEVMVNAEDPALRANRKALLRRLGAIFLRVLDFSRL
jgi:glycyl-tRNA synthetase beta chain